ncbi:MAG: toprim domain-containing protein, partial [Planctomycetaceae bacterium]|nr:toprim domain-containing protein [Planctomycetaceae bacterium]
CGITLDVAGHGDNVRLDCPFGCSGDHAGKREISVNVTNPQKVFCCHAYGCQVRGNLLSLMHGWLTGMRPTGEKLKGNEFTRVRDALVGKPAAPSPAPSAVPAAPTPTAAPSKPTRNQPLAQSDNDKAREPVTIDEKFVVDVAAMSPAAASYVRRHPCLSPVMLQKWRAGVLPADCGGDKRAWSLRGQILYPVLSEDGQILAWVTRDVQFEMNEGKFNALPPELRAKEKKPAKHRFPVNFRRGLELFGQHASRLKEPGYRESIARHGIIVVEGFNDVIGLDGLAVPALAIMSNKITVEQVTKIERWAKSLAGGKVALLFDADDAGDEGAKETLWLLAQRGLDVRLGWSRVMHGGTFAGRQPESLTAEEWETAIRPAMER